MKKPRLFLTLGLPAVFIIAACAPVGTEAPTQPSVTFAVEPSITLEATAQPPGEAEPIATSRGPNLEATDPTTVSLASGQIHFVEFFRFT